MHKSFDQRLTQLEFVECDSCRSKPGSPQLCGGCRHNRAVISSFQRLTPAPVAEAWLKYDKEGCRSVTVVCHDPYCKVHGR